MLCSITLLSSCAIKENELVIIDNKENSKNSVSDKLKDWQIDLVSQKVQVEKNKEAIAQIDENIIPITISPDHNIVIGYNNIEDETTDERNSMIIAGNMVQYMDLFSYNIASSTKKV